MKVALCLYGQPRFLENPHVVESHKRFILEKFDTKTFCHFWFDPEDKLFLNSNFTASPGGCSAAYSAINFVHKDTKKILFERYSPEAYICEKPKTFPPPEPLPKFCNHKAYSEANISNFQSQLYSWQKVLELFVQNTEAEEYKFVVVMRYDCILFSFPRLPKQGVVYAHPTYDLCIIDPRKCEGVKPYSDFNSIAPDVWEFDVARFKRIALQRNGLATDESKSWKFGLARSNTDNTPGG